MPLVATDTMLNRRINSAGTLFSPVGREGDRNCHRCVDDRGATGESMTRCGLRAF